jgi:hypothetical protein
MSTDTVLIGRMRMREDLTVVEGGSEDGDRTFALTGTESRPRLSSAAIERAREDWLTMAGQLVPVVFSIKDYLNGFYTFKDVSGTIEDWSDQLVTFRWSANFTRNGTDGDMDLESRLSGAQSRTNNFTVTGERVHAPSIGATSYWTRGTVSSVLSRTGSDGVMKLYRGIGMDISPRWVVSPASYLAGRVMFLDDLGLERSGEGARLSATTWELNNGLVRVKPLSSGGVLEVSAWSGGAWQPKAWDLTVTAVSTGAFDFVSILANQPEMVAIRLVKSMTIGRLYVDLVLRRGYRFVEVYVQHELGATLKLVRASAEAGTNSLGGTVVATSNDGAGNKYIIGSARTFTADVLNGGLSLAATSTLDAFIGAVVGGSGAVAGDQAADLQKQYVGAPTELVQGVRR